MIFFFLGVTFKKRKEIVSSYFSNVLVNLKYSFM